MAADDDCPDKIELVTHKMRKLIILLTIIQP